MSEYSREFNIKNNLGHHFDFSIEREFNKLKEGERINIICEGFGFTQIINIDDECYVLLKNKEVNFLQFSGIKIEKKENYWGLFYLFAIITIVWLFGWVLIEAFVKPDLEETKGTFGDMFGSINSLFSGLALGGIIYTIILQRKELKLQRKELRETRKEFTIQNETLTIQRFENTFFQMINLHHELIDKMNIDSFIYLMVNDEPIYVGLTHMQVQQKESYHKRDAIEFAKHAITTLFKRCFSDEEMFEFQPDIEVELEKYMELYYIFHNEFDNSFSHFYRNIYHIFKYIYESELISENNKEHYATIVIAQLSQSELLLLYTNSLIPGLGYPKLLFLIKEFNIVENLHERVFTDNDLGRVKQVFDYSISKVINPFKAQVN